MNKRVPALIFSSALLAACGPNKIVYDLPSPSGKYHVQVRQCPQSGSITWSEKLQVSVLEAGVSAACQSAVQALAQFDANEAASQLQLEWISDTELRAWLPGFNVDYGPSSATYKHDNPVKVIFSPR